MSTPPAAPLRIALVGDHDPHITAHRAIPLALRLAGEALGLEIAFDWLASDRLPAEPALERYDGFWCVPGSPYRDADAVLRLIAHARGRRRPFLGTCAGFQHTILEFARNALGWQAATHGEEHPHSDQAVIAALPCALLEAREEVRLLRGSRLALAYAADWIEADYHCRYAIAPRFAAELTGGALRASAWSADGAIRAVELEQHPFFVATLFQPERAALAGVLPPLPKAFVEACRTQRRDRPRRGPTPYYPVIFSSHRSAVDDGYAEAAERMLELASRQPGYLGVESVRGADGFGITVSYWDSEAAIRAWSRHAEHRDAQARGRRDWYAGFSARIARVEREYAFPAQPDTAQSPASS
ncbi:CTP synthase C-terminal region-related (seleno)protein [Pseudomonas aeruginosa]|uniref:CTP synthase C-terminal region-related (seleno)protein n=1 Tax=Pseudomonas aeruginosa TaxID=287 RepID=UPI000EB3B810|nr:antibiotic biosynthesis monooxygenase [Pseudomonas aeruginosa]